MCDISGWTWETRPYAAGITHSYSDFNYEIWLRNPADTDGSPYRGAVRSRYDGLFTAVVYPRAGETKAIVLADRRRITEDDAKEMVESWCRAQEKLRRRLQSGGQTDG